MNSIYRFSIHVCGFNKKMQTLTVLTSLPVIPLKKIVAITCNSKDLTILCEK